MAGKEKKKKELQACFKNQSGHLLTDALIKILNTNCSTQEKCVRSVAFIKIKYEPPYNQITILSRMRKHVEISPYNLLVIIGFGFFLSRVESETGSRARRNDANSVTRCSFAEPLCVTFEDTCTTAPSGW